MHFIASLIKRLDIGLTKTETRAQERRAAYKRSAAKGALNINHMLTALVPDTAVKLA